MPDFDYERTFLEAAAPELKRYLLSDEVYWNLGLRAPAGTRPYPQFSLGWLLLFRRRVGSEANEEVLTQIEEIEKKWKSAWARKAAREFEQRLKLWTQFMNEIRESPEMNRDRYAYEVQRRTMLELLADDADELPDEQVKLLRAMDSALRGMLKTSGFIEDEGYAGRFPKERFWFLYGRT